MPGLGEFGEREPKITPRAGKRVGARATLSPSRVTRAKGRDTLLEEELHQMTEALKGRDQFICIDTLRELKKAEGKSRNPNKPQDAGVFGEPEQNKIRPQRIRRDYTTEELAKIHPIDRRREDAAERMQCDSDMIHKMANCNYPLPRKPEEAMGRKKSFHNEPHIDVAVDGFKGLGFGSKAEHKRSKAGAPTGPFVPEFRPAPRNAGKRVLAMPGSGSYGEAAANEPNRNISQVF